MKFQTYEKFILGAVAVCSVLAVFSLYRNLSQVKPPPRKVVFAEASAPVQIDPAWHLPDTPEPPKGRDRVMVSKTAWKFAPAYQGQSAAQLYAQLAGRAITTADSPTVGALAEALILCRRQIMLRAVLESKQGDKLQPNEVDKIRSEADGYDTACADLPKEAFDRSDGFIEQLAADGDLRAMALYATGTMGFGNRYQDLIRDPARYQQFKENTYRYLEQLVDAGYYPALGRLSDLAMSEWSQPDPTKAWAYYYASTLARGDVGLQQTALERLGKVVPAEKQAEAQALAQQVYARCCQK